LAGLGGQGNVNYVKHELNASYHQPLASEVSFSTSVRAGIFTSVGEEGPRVSDRFYLGGPLSVRGFEMGGIGERTGSK
jgi:outer membrane protein insertion porin family